MSRHYRTILTLAASTSLLVSAFAVVKAAESPSVSRWSDPGTWPNRKVPIAGDKVTIGRDKDVILDVSPPALGGLSIDGKLTFADNTGLELTTEWIMLHGELVIGTEGDHHADRQRQS